MLGDSWMRSAEGESRSGAEHAGQEGPSPTSPASDLSIVVVIPAYNAAGTIERALASVLAQTRPPDEIIVSDDGSEDDTATRAAAFSPAVTVVSSGHGGAAAARNAGDAAASSRYIAYLDADDTWVPNKLEVFGSVAEALGWPPFLFSDFRRYMDDTDRFMPLTNTEIFSWIERWPGEEAAVDGLRVRRFAPEAAMEALLRGYPIWPSTEFVDRALVEKVGGWNPQFTRSQDFDIALRMAFTAGMVYIGAPLTLVHVNSDHASRFDWTSRQLEWDIRVLRHHAGADFFPAEQRRLIRTYIGKRTVYRGDFSRKHGRIREALRWYLRALTTSGGRLRGATRLLEILVGFPALVASRRSGKA